MTLPWDPGPIAHRGLHDIANGIVENSPAAVDAALTSGFGIEVDLQVAADDVAMVFHDFTLDRLTEAKGPVRNRPSDELSKLRYSDGQDRIMRLDELLETVDGGVPLYVELKSDFSGDRALCRSVAPLVNAYSGPVALMSFDPWMVRDVSRLCPRVPCGLVSGTYETQDWDPHVADTIKRFALRHMLTATLIRPAFINYDISAISSLAPQIARRIGCPLLTWTVRTIEQRQMAAKWADAMVFEGFMPTPEECAVGLR